MKLKVLCACEESQAVCKEFRILGHEAYSCDILECSGGYPFWHIRDDVLRHMSGWDLIIAFPPCTYLTVTGNRWFNIEKYGEMAIQRHRDRYNAIEFFMRFITADCKYIAVENPIGIMSTHYRKPDQIIQPWQYAIYDYENTEKSTCLWLKNLPKLIPYHTERPEVKYHDFTQGKRQTEWYYHTRCLPHEYRARAASKTFPGIARAMAAQWSKYIIEQEAGHEID